ncbi:MAG TPA: MFS transporter [Microcoleaceae cyanobacterium]|jgi:MFS family permease
MTTAITSGLGRRWRIPIVLAVTVFVNYLDRNNLALALPQIAADFGWSDRELGANGEWLLAAFFLSYALSNLLLSPIAERFGAKRSIILAIVAFSLFTLLCAPFGQSLTALIILRLLLGLGEGVHIPMLSAITSQWFPASERSRANAIWGAGIILAVAAAPLIIVPLTNAIGWRLTFAVLGLAGLAISLPLVIWLVQDAPRRQGTNTTAPAEMPAEQLPSEQHPVIRSSPRYTRDRRFWLTVLGGSLNAFCAFGILNWLPTYFNRAKGINFEQLGWPLTLIFSAGLVGLACMAYLGDRYQRRTWLAGFGFVIAGIMVLLAAQVNNLAVLVLCFAIAVFCQSAYGAQEYAIVQHLLPPDRVGAGTGLYNGLSILFGGVGGSLIPGTIAAATGSFDAAMLSIVVGTLAASMVMFGLWRMLRY